MCRDRSLTCDSNSPIRQSTQSFIKISPDVPPRRCNPLPIRSLFNVYARAQTVQRLAQMSCLAVTLVPEAGKEMHPPFTSSSASLADDRERLRRGLLE